MKDLEQEVLQYLKERNWDKIRPSDVAKSISIEAAEMLEIFQWVDMTIAELKKDRGRSARLKDELGDVLIYCLELTALLGLDTEKIIRDKLERAREKYPAALMRKMTDRKNPGTEKAYLKIKESYRRRKRT